MNWGFEWGARWTMSASDFLALGGADIRPPAPIVPRPVKENIVKQLHVCS